MRTFFSSLERLSNGVETFNEFWVLALVVEALDNLIPNSGHDPHVDPHVSRVGQFNANFGERSADGTHAEGDHVHCAA